MSGAWWGPRGYQTWTCTCGRMHLATALETCPECGAGQDGQPPPQAAPAPVPARKRARTAKGTRP